MTFRATLRDELHIVVERYLAERDPVAPGDVDVLGSRVTTYEARVPSAAVATADLKSLVDQLGTLTRELVAVRKACGEALRGAREAHTQAEHALARAETVASEIP